MEKSKGKGVSGGRSALGNALKKGSGEVSHVGTGQWLVHFGRRHRIVKECQAKACVYTWSSDNRKHWKVFELRWQDPSYILETILWQWCANWIEKENVKMHFNGRNSRAWRLTRKEGQRRPWRSVPKRQSPWARLAPNNFVKVGNIENL